MESTQLGDLEVKKKAQNWQYVELQDRDILLFKTILEQKFLTKTQVIDYIFKGMKSYAELRLRKLKKFGYLTSIKHLIREPESYLVTQIGVEALRVREHAIGTMGFPVQVGVTLPLPQKEIEFTTYDHDKKVTDIRFLFQKLGFGKNWHSEKLLKLGKKGERKVPDGLFLIQGGEKILRIAFELELSEKSKRRYEKILNQFQSSKYDFILYVCGSTALRHKLKKLTKGSYTPYLFLIYDDLMKNKGKAELLGSQEGRLLFEELTGKSKTIEDE